MRNPECRTPQQLSTPLWRQGLLVLVAVLVMAATTPDRLPPVVDHGPSQEFTLEERQEIDLIVRREAGLLVPQTQPWFAFVSGGWGIGKSTMIRSVLAERPRDLPAPYVIDIDVFRTELSLWTQAPDRTQVLARTTQLAGVIAEKLMWLAFEKNASFIFPGAFRDRQFMIDLLSEIHIRYPRQYESIQWVHMMAPLEVLKDHIQARNGTDERKTHLDQAIQSAGQSRLTFETIRNRVPIAMVMDRIGNESRITWMRDRQGEHQGLFHWQPWQTQRPVESLAVTGASARSNESKAIILDLDWTLFATVQDETEWREKGREKDLIHVDGKTYVLAEGAQALLDFLLAQRDVQVHVFSGGDPERNRALLQHLRLSNGRSLAEELQLRRGQVWSIDHLTPVRPEGQGFRFSQRLKKRIQGYLPEIRIENILLIDDLVEFADGGLRVLPSFGVFNPHPDYRPDLAGGLYEPPNREQWRAESQRLWVLKDIVSWALTESRSGRGDFADLAASRGKLLKIGNSEWWDHAKSGHAGLNPDPRCQSLFRR